MDSSDIKIIDIKGKKSVNCPYCGFKIDVVPREISMEGLKHMKEVEKFGELHKKTVSKDIHGLVNLRAGICPNCNKPIFFKDEFSKDY